MVNKASEGDIQAIYELCYLILPSIPQDKLSSVTESIRKVVEKVQGKELDAEEPFKHPLAYSMSKTIGASRYTVADAYIGWIKFEAEPSQIASIEAEVAKIPEVLRFLVTKAPQKTYFTFASAREALEEVENDSVEVTEEVAPSPVEESDIIEKNVS